MSINNRGRHNKYQLGPSRPGLDRDRMEKLYKWQSFTNKQREAYGYNFENYITGKRND